jgi:hypothetical protein
MALVSLSDLNISLNLKRYKEKGTWNYIELSLK